MRGGRAHPARLRAAAVQRRPRARDGQARARPRGALQRGPPQGPSAVARARPVGERRLVAPRAAGGGPLAAGRRSGVGRGRGRPTLPRRDPGAADAGAARLPGPRGPNLSLSALRARSSAAVRRRAGRRGPGPQPRAAPLPAPLRRAAGCRQRPVRRGGPLPGHLAGRVPRRASAATPSAGRIRGPSSTSRRCSCWRRGS